MILYMLHVRPDGTPSLEVADENDIRESFQDTLRDAALQEAADAKKAARQSELQAHKFHDAIIHLRRLVREVKAGVVALDDVMEFMERTRSNVIALEAVGGGYQATPMPDAPVPE